MGHHVIEIVRDHRTPRPELFALLADHDALGRAFGAPMRRIRAGDTSPNGVGSVRKIGVGPLGIEETVTAVVENESIEYRISRGGGPVRNHRGRIDVTDSGDGARVTWHIEFDSLPIVGRAVALGLRVAIAHGLSRIR